MRQNRPADRDAVRSAMELWQNVPWFRCFRPRRSSRTQSVPYPRLSPDVNASAHLVIGREGKIIQLVPFDTEAWHAGRSWYAGRSGLNRYSIGIELDNLGLLRWREGLFIAECGRIVPAEEVYTHDSGGKLTYWHRYTRVQVQTLMKVCEVLEEYYPIKDVVGHSAITTRKVDPGPALESALRE